MMLTRRLRATVSILSPYHWQLGVYAFAVFLILYGIGIPIEEYDGMNRRQVADTMWQGGPLGSTWFDFGSILSLYLFYFPAAFVKALAHFKAPIAEIAVGFHGAFFVTACSVLMLAFIRRMQSSERNALDYESPALADSAYWPWLFLFCNPVLFSSERYLIETPLAFYLLAVVYLYIFYSRRPPALAGVLLLFAAASMAVLTRGPSALFLAPFLLASLITRRHRQTCALAFGIICGVIGTLLWNLHRFGDAFGYAYGAQHFDAKTWQGVYAFLLSPGLGIFTFYPLSFFGCRYLYRRMREANLMAYTVGAGVLLFATLFASWCVYNGGLTYGPRFLLPILPILGVLGLLQIATVKSRTIQRLICFSALLWGAFVNLNALLMPPFFFYQQWSASVRPWDFPAEEAQIQMDYGERLQIFDPDYSHYIGGWATFWTRRDLWEIPFLKFASRSGTTSLILTPRSEVQTFSLISRGSKPQSWYASHVKLFDATSGNSLPFDFADQPAADLPYAGPPMASGSQVTIRLKVPRSAPFRLEWEHGAQPDSFPFSLVVQTTPGTYFGGNLNSPSYIPFRKSFQTVNQVAGLEPKALPFGIGLCLLAGLSRRRLTREALEDGSDEAKT